MKTRGKKRQRHETCHRKGRPSQQQTNHFHEADTSPSKTQQNKSNETITQITIDTERCMMCKKCERECPSGAITVNEIARVTTPGASDVEHAS